MPNSKGFTLVEVIIVAAIIAVLSSVLISGVSLVSSSGAAQSVNAISSALSFARVKTMSGEPSVELVISLEEGGYYCTVFANGEEAQKEMIADTGAQLFYTESSGVPTFISSTNTLEIAYDISGALSKPIELQTIEMHVGNTVYAIKITAETGFHEIVQSEKMNE